MNSVLQVKKLSDDGIIPTRGTPFAAGIDLYSPLNTSVEPFSRQLVKLDIAVEIPENMFGHILPRSGIALKSGIHIGAGIIDSDYRGNLGVLLFNLSNIPFVIERGDRIAQLVIKKYEKLDIVEVNETSSTCRGNMGFGSTGK